MARRIVLASTSPYRRMQMDTLRIPYEVAAPDYDEEHELPLPPRDLVMHLAEAKARSLAGRYPDALIVGSDQAPVVDDQLLRKPGSSEAAAEQLLLLAGRWHELLTAVSVLDSASGRVESELDVARLLVRPLSRSQAQAYARAEQTWDCAGAYKTESLGLALFEDIRCQDPTALVGLPLLRLVRLLGRFGCDVLDLALGAVARSEGEVL